MQVIDYIIVRICSDFVVALKKKKIQYHVLWELDG